MKLKQDMTNVFGRRGIKAGIDYDLAAIDLMRAGVKITEKDVDGYIQHCLTYLHPSIDTRGVGWMGMVGCKHDNPKIQKYLSGVFATLKKVVRSYDSKLASAMFKDGHLEKKYHLGTGLKVTAKTLEFVKTCTIAKTPRKKVEEELEKNIEIRNARFDHLHDKNEACKEIGSAESSELDEVVAPLIPLAPKKKDSLTSKKSKAKE